MWLMPDHAHYQFDPKMIASQNSFWPIVHYIHQMNTSMPHAP